MIGLKLREVIDDDLSTFFEQQKDEAANRMAAFISRDPNNREEFDKHWEKIRDDATIIIRTIEYRKSVVGNVASFLMKGKREVSYWIGKEFWGQGIATEALLDFIKIIEERPLYAHVAFDNFGSIRVLEKSGFNKIGKSNFFAKARSKEIEEYIFELPK